MQENKLSALTKEYIKRTNEIFPGLDFGSSYSFYSGEEPTTCEFEFYNHSKAIRNSIYNASKCKYFIHYTSIDSLFSIINSAKLRLYNLHNLNDPKELKYVSEEMGILKKEYDFLHYQNGMFLTSFCGYDPINLQLDENYNMWRLYGHDGYGVGIVFELENYSDDWNDVYLGKVHYGKESEAYRMLGKYIQFHQSFNGEHRIFRNEPKWMPIISMLHKDDIWEIENEYRLFAYNPFQDYEFKRDDMKNRNNLLFEETGFAINKKGEKVAYTHIRLDSNKFKDDLEKRHKEYAMDIYTTFPHFKINKIILGYNISDKTKNNIKGHYEYIDRKMGYQISINQSIFKERLK